MHCNFLRNVDLARLIEIDLRHSSDYFITSVEYFMTNKIAFSSTNISFIRSEFMSNKCELLKILNEKDIIQPNLFFKFLNTVRNVNSLNIFEIAFMNVHISGHTNITYNSCDHIYHYKISIMQYLLQ